MFRTRNTLCFRASVEYSAKFLKETVYMFFSLYFAFSCIKRDFKADPCEMCQKIIDIVEEELESESGEEKIEEKLHEFCETLPSVLQGLCSELVETYTPAIVQYLEEQIAGLDICVRLGYCDGTAKRIR